MSAKNERPVINYNNFIFEVTEVGDNRIEKVVFN
nr:hypothetical protein [Virgibacillus indicus]